MDCRFWKGGTPLQVNLQDLLHFSLYDCSGRRLFLLRQTPVRIWFNPWRCWASPLQQQQQSFFIRISLVDRVSGDLQHNLHSLIYFLKCNWPWRSFGCSSNILLMSADTLEVGFLMTSCCFWDPLVFHRGWIDYEVSLQMPWWVFLGRGDAPVKNWNLFREPYFRTRSV